MCEQSLPRFNSRTEESAQKRPLTLPVLGGLHCGPCRCEAASAHRMEDELKKLSKLPGASLRASLRPAPSIASRPPSSRHRESRVRELQCREPVRLEQYLRQVWRLRVRDVQVGLPVVLLQSEGERDARDPDRRRHPQPPSPLLAGNRSVELHARGGRRAAPAQRRRQ